MINSFPIKPSKNLSGLKTFDFIPVKNVSVYPEIYGGQVLATLTLVAGTAILKGYATSDTLSFIENQKENEHGVYFEQNISGFTPGDKPELIDLTQNMAVMPFYVIVSDFNGIKRLAGFGQNLRFTSEFTSGTSRTEQKGHKFTFTGFSLFKAPVYPF